MLDPDATRARDLIREAYDPVFKKSRREAFQYIHAAILKGKPYPHREHSLYILLGEAAMALNKTQDGRGLLRRFGCEVLEHRELWEESTKDEFGFDLAGRIASAACTLSEVRREEGAEK